jgi:hypothetical protein
MIFNIMAVTLVPAWISFRFTHGNILVTASKVRLILKQATSSQSLHLYVLQVPNGAFMGPLDLC